MMSVEEKAMELTTRLDDGGWKVETNVGPILFPADAGAMAVATARIEAEMLLKHRVILLQFSLGGSVEQLVSRVEAAM